MFLGPVPTGAGLCAIEKYHVLLLMEEILHQLRLVVYPTVYRVLYIPGGCLGFLPSTVSSQLEENSLFYDIVGCC